MKEISNKKAEGLYWYKWDVTPHCQFHTSEIMWNCLPSACV